MITLIQLQDAAIAKLNVARSSEKRYTKMRRSVRKWFVYKMLARGYTENQARAAWIDARDMSELQRSAE